MARLARAAVLTVSPHQLRHTSCHEFVERGEVPLDRVALLAGHTTASGRPQVETTVRYTTPSQEELERAVRTIEWEYGGGVEPASEGGIRHGRAGRAFGCRA